jgi:hypothetical protein
LNLPRAACDLLNRAGDDPISIRARGAAWLGALAVWLHAPAEVARPVSEIEAGRGDAIDEPSATVTGARDVASPPSGAGSVGNRGAPASVASGGRSDQLAAAGGGGRRNMRRENAAA